MAALVAACGGAGNQVPPVAPGGVTATPIAGGIRVTWEDLSDNESEFVVYRSDADAAEGEDGAALTEVGRSPGDATFYQDFGVTMGGSYRYAVAAINQFGASDQVLQEPSDPVSPAVGVRLTITVDGAGHVAVDDGFETVTCASECVFGVTSGATVSLTAVGSDETAFAGWAGACGGAGTCRLTPSADADVEARFREHVLVLVSTGDSAVATEISPPDAFNNTACVLDPGESCAFGYDFGAALKVSVNSVVVEGDEGATFAGYGGACSSPQGRFCLVDVDGATEVEIEVVRAPTVNDRSFPAREDTKLEVDEADGVLRDVEDSVGDTHTAEVVAPPSSGVLELANDGSFTYQPAEDANGEVTFEFRAVDAHGNRSATRTVTMSVVAVNDPPRFQLGSDPVATVGNGNPVTRAGFATGVHPGGGPDEGSQVLTFTVTRAPGQPDLMATAPSLTRVGGAATLTYTPAPGVFGTAQYNVVLKDDGGTANGGNDTSEPQNFTITVSPVVLSTSVASGEGSISRDPVGGATGTPSTHNYGWGTSVELRATPESGYVFALWDGACDGQPNPCTVTMDGNKSVSATFWPIVRVDGNAFVFVSSSPAGINNCNPVIDSGTCTWAYEEGTSLTLNVNSATYITGVTCEPAQTNPTNTCTFTVTQPVTVNLNSSP